jgi:hypothetical protein
VDPKAAPATCPAPTLVSGGTDAAPDPGTACLAPVQPSALDPVPAAAFGWIDLGEHAVGEVLTFQVPAGTASVTLLEQWVSGGPASATVTATAGGNASTQPNAAVVGELRDPSGALIYTDFVVGAPADGSSALLFIVPFHAVTGTVTYPNTSAGLVALGPGGAAPGAWSALVNDYAYECWLASQPSPPPGLAGVTCIADSRRNDTRYRVYALTKAAASGSASAIPDAGALDVSFHIVDSLPPVLGIDSAGAPSDPRLVRMVESYGRLMANAGVCLGTVTFYDAPDWARLRFATGVSDADVGPCSNLSQLLTLSVPSAATLDLFLVPRIGAGGAVIGIDGSIPGPATVNGTVASGAVVSAEDLPAGTCPAPGEALSLAGCGADKVALIAAHESGHYFGLYHVTEAFGTQFDPLGDTPHCTCDACGLSDCSGGLSARTCDQHYPQCSGGGNLMFWVWGPDTSAGYLSPEQARVVRASPLVRSP